MKNEIEAVFEKAIHDPRLSWRAKGVFAAFLFRRSSYNFNKAWIIENGREGRDAITAAIRELKKLGYLNTRGIQEKNTGQMIDNKFELAENTSFTDF